MNKNFKWIKHFLFILFLSVLHAQLFAQITPLTITGTVKDSTGAPISGASIIVKDSKKKAGTSTDVNGRFILDAEPGSMLSVSSVGFQVVELPAKTVMNIVLKSLGVGLDDVVVTAYGKKQRREAVVGSVTSVNVPDLKIPSSNLTNALAGQVAGIIGYQRGGQPGLDNASFFIRGVTTFGYSASPLILIDNIELTSSDLARLQVDDIASFSILKDASASALYGARGANGVILVTTKEGKAGKAKINVRYENSISKPTQNIELADPISFMKNYNEAITTRDPLATPFFDPNKIINTQATIDKAPGSNAYVNPAVDWMSTMFKKQTTTNRLNFSVGGGTDVAKYYIAGSYSRDNGILQSNPVNNFNSGMKYENYQLRSNMNVNITKTTEVILRLWGNFNDYTGPITNDGSGLATDLYTRVLHTSPVRFPAYYAPDSASLLANHILFGNASGGGSNTAYDNPYAHLMSGYKNFAESRMSAQFELNQNLGFLVKGLTFHGLFSTNRYSYFDQVRQYKPFYYEVQTYDPKRDQYTLNWINDQPGQAQEFLSYYPGSKNVTTYLYLLGSLDYSRTFGNHSISSAVIATRQQDLNANAVDPFTYQPSLQYSLPYRNVGVSGRVSYSYDLRYFLEFNFGYNASERFSKNNRWGFFPTIGAGWVISNEKLWQDHHVSDIVTRLKLRASYGRVGNDRIGAQRFFYLSDVHVGEGSGATFGTSNGFSQNGTLIRNYPNPDVTWESSAKSNLGLELTVLKKLNIVAEIYREHRTDILQPRGFIPSTDGLEAGISANLGTAYSKGLDLSLDYKQNITKNWWASARANLTLTESHYGHVEEPEYAEPWRFQSGKAINQQFGYIAERLFVDDKEAINSPSQRFGQQVPAGGDIKYRDLNNDGIIDQHDLAPIGLPTSPQIVYGFGFSTGYKGFDLSAFFQGLARESFFIDASGQIDYTYGNYGTAPFVNNAQLLKAYADNHWSAENQNLYALWPRLSATSNANNEQRSSWWLRDGSFMRLKSLEAGYTIPQRFTRRLYLQNARIYLNGLNLLTFSHFKLWDPEMAASGFGYPVQKVFNVGINMNF